MDSEQSRYIDNRQAFLLQLLLVWVDRVLQYLFLTNSGGAVAILSFMGASDTVRSMSGPKWALAFFLLGLILLGVLSAYQLYRASMLSQKWRSDSADFLTKQITWQYLVNEDQKRSKIVTTWIGHTLGFASFGCFCVGAVIGVFLLIWN